MKLYIGENIRNFRKKNVITQEALAERLGVTYQSVSRWENGTTYPDLELIPAIADVLAVTVDELIGMPQIEKEKRAVATFDELRRECMKHEYDTEKIVGLLRDIRRNYIRSDYAWRPWSDGNDWVFRDPKILPEVRLLAEAYLQLFPMSPQVLWTMAMIEDEEHLQAFLDQYSTPYDCSQRALLFDRYYRRGDKERFEVERRYRLSQAFDALLCHSSFKAWGDRSDDADEFMEDLLSLIRRDAIDDRPDMWLEERLEQGIKSARRFVKAGNLDAALSKLESVVGLLEQTMAITTQVCLPTSCRFLEGMEWSAEEMYDSPAIDPDGDKERYIFMQTEMNGMISCHCIYPSYFYGQLTGKDLEALAGNAEFQSLCERVKALIVIREKGE